MTSLYRYQNQTPVNTANTVNNKIWLVMLNISSRFYQWFKSVCKFHVKVVCRPLCFLLDRVDDRFIRTEVSVKQKHNCSKRLVMSFIIPNGSFLHENMQHATSQNKASIRISSNIFLFIIHFRNKCVFLRYFPNWIISTISITGTKKDKQLNPWGPSRARAWHYVPYSIVSRKWNQRDAVLSVFVLFLTMVGIWQ